MSYDNQNNIETENENPLPSFLNLVFYTSTLLPLKVKILE